MRWQSPIRDELTPLVQCRLVVLVLATRHSGRVSKLACSSQALRFYPSKSQSHLCDVAGAGFPVYRLPLRFQNHPRPATKPAQPVRHRAHGGVFRGLPLGGSYWKLRCVVHSRRAEDARQGAAWWFVLCMHSRLPCPACNTNIGCNHSGEKYFAHTYS